MEPNTAIVVEGLSKCYRIGLEERYDSLVGACFGWLKSPLKNYRKHRSLYRFDEIRSENRETHTPDSPDILWALNNVSFEVKQGEVLGIVGRNGAGKSTLLKILSKITEPTFGKAKIRGRVSSLLEVGTGFHPELTGRENIYVNGTILGMSKKEVDRKFDEIVDFSGVEKFIDTPVKRYSSGMNVRLAFAVAAHLDPEVLIIDEVLAVGDLSFQKKCMGKMGSVATSGRTVLFVSHNLGAVTKLCQSGLWLDGGHVQLHGGVHPVVESYAKEVVGANAIVDPDSWVHNGSGEAIISNAVLFNETNQVTHTFNMKETLICELEIDIRTPINYLDGFHIGIRRADIGVNLLHVMSQDVGLTWENLSQGRRKVRVEIPECTLYPGSYEIDFLLGSGNKQLDYVKNALGFEMLEGNSSKRSHTFSYYSNSALIHVRSNWEEIVEDD